MNEDTDAESNAILQYNYALLLTTATNFRPSNLLSAFCLA